MTITQALKDVANTLRMARDRERPASMLIGAGVSKAGGIPLANEIVAQIRRDYEHRPGVDKIDPESPHSYGASMGALKSNERRDLLQSYFKNAKVNWANLAIAQLIALGLIDRVLTVNFDPLLAKACALVGVSPAVYDFAASPSGDVRHLASPAIVHLHGQSYGLKLLNTKEQTDAHCSAIIPIVRDTLERGPLLVIGYSGGADGVFTALSDCYRGEEQLYWLGYSDMPSEQVADFLLRQQCCFAPRTDADRYLIALALALDARPPLVFRKPAEFLLNSLNELTDYPSSQAETAVDILVGLRRNLELSKMSEEPGDGNTIEALTDAYMRGKHSDVVPRVSRLIQIKAASKEMILVGYLAGLDRVQADTSAGLDESFAIVCEHAVDLVETPQNPLTNWGCALASIAKRSKGAEAQRLFDQACQKYELALKHKPDMLLALSNWGTTLLDMATCSELDNREQWFALSEEKLKAADHISPGACSYNLACLKAITDEPEQAREYLFACQRYGRLPGRSYIEKDPDLAKLQELPWFGELLQLAPSETSLA